MVFLSLRAEDANSFFYREQEQRMANEILEAHAVRMLQKASKSQAAAELAFLAAQKACRNAGVTVTGKAVL